jgi:hypothetical protein
MELLAILGLLIIIPLNAVLEGWVLTTLWGWFVVPTFDLPQLTVVPAIGLCLIVNFLVQIPPKEKKKDEDTATLVGQLVAKAIFMPLFFLFLGWIVNLFMAG